MRIKEITSQHRRDFTAILECQHCGAEEELISGYDDYNYHANVIPNFKCKKCGKKGGKDKPFTPKYPEGMVV